MAKKLLAILLGFSSLAIGLYFMIDPDVIPYAGLLWPFFGILIFLAIRLYISALRDDIRTAAKEEDKEIEQFKTAADKIEINLEDIEIVKENFAEVGKELGEAEMRQWQEIHAMSNETGVEIDQTILRYTTNYQGKKTNFFHVLYSVDEQYLMLAFMNQKTTNLYIENSDEGLIYVFDFSFLQG